MDIDLLHRFFIGQTSLEEGQAIRQWIETSEDNKRLFLRERRLYDAFLLNTDIPSLALSNKKEAKIRHHFIQFIFKAAVVVIFILTGYHFTVNHLTSPHSLENTIVKVPPGQRTLVTLPDGSNVWLNSCSQLKYTTPFEGNQRCVQLNGQAYFEVTKNEKIPFIVQTCDFDIEVLGTSFDVDAYKALRDSFFETTLLEGSVKITSRKDNKDMVVLEPSQKVSLINGALKVSSVDDFDPYRWREGLICFRNQPLNQILKEFEKTFDIHINIQNEKYMNHTYTGKFRQLDGIDYALKILQKEIQFRYERDEENGTINIK